MHHTRTALLVFAAVASAVLCAGASGQAIKTIAGSGSSNYGGDGGLAINAGIYSPTWVSLDAAGNVYINAAGDNRIRVVNMQTTPITIGGVTIQPGDIQTVAGNGQCCDSANNTLDINAELNYPHSISLDPAGNIYIGDMYNNEIRVVNVGTKPITILGVTIEPSDIATVIGNGGNAYVGDGGPASAAQLYYPTDVTIDKAGNIYLADTGNNAIRVVNMQTTPITLAGVTIQPGYISTVAGNGVLGYSGDNGPATHSELYYPHCVEVDSAGNIYIADMYNFRIRAVNVGTAPTTIAGVVIQPGNIATIAGTGVSGYSGDGGPAAQAEIFNAEALIIGPTGNIFLADTDNNVIREISPAGIINTIAGTGVFGYNGDGGALTTMLAYPLGMALDSSGNIYFADRANQRVRELTLAQPSAVPVLGITKSHTGNFQQGQQGAAYTVSVSNAPNSAVTSGTVTVTETVPQGMTLSSIGGTNWQCSGNQCTRNDPLNGAASYPPITVKVNVAPAATSPQVNEVQVSGGGATSSATTSDSTVITNVPASITATGGATQSTATGTPFSTALQVTVLDANSNPLSGILVTFTAPTTSPSGTFANGTNSTTVATDSQGVATASTFTANATAGGYSATASVPGLGQAASFSLSNLMPTGPAATFVATDTTTQGTWLGHYGSDGYDIASVTPANTPKYATFSENGSSYTWASSTTDARGLLLPDSTTQRLATTWFSYPSFAFQIDFTDGNSHQLSLYALDWDSQGRSETITVQNAATNALLNTQTISKFSGGIYLVWNVAGSVKITVTSISGPNAVISGVFFDPVGTFSGGSGGGGGSGPVTVSVTPTTIGLGANQTQTFTATVENSTNQTVTWSINPNVGSINSSTGAYKAPSTITAAQAVTVTATSTSGPFGTATVNLTAGALANFVTSNTTVEGTWRGTYGADGHFIAQDSTTVPSYAAFSISGDALFTWVPTTTDPRALENGANTGRLAACAFTYSSMTFDVNFTDGDAHPFELYALDWDSKGRVETIRVADAASGAVLNTQTISNFSSGVYLIWNITGHVKITVTTVSGPNAVISGAFFN